jgi:4-aminobutyrate aminotransferase-like enzyme
MAPRPADTANLIRYGMQWADSEVSQAAGSHVHDAHGRAAICGIAPPLTASHEAIDLGLAILDQAMGECLAA